MKRNTGMLSTTSVCAGAIAVPEGGFGRGDGPIFLNRVECAGHEENLLQCSSSGVALHQACGHSYDAGVICTRKLMSTVMIIMTY